MISYTEARRSIREADAILIGASNGLSISEGYNIFACNEMFLRDFGDFKERYGIESVLQGCFAQYEGREEFLRRLVKLWTADYLPSPVMLHLHALVSAKPHFALTTNADQHLEAAGFAPERVFAMEGTFEDVLHRRQPTDRRQEFAQFMEMWHGRRILFLELGIGSRNRIIKAPMMQLCQSEPQGTYIAMNLAHELWVEESIAQRSILLAGDIGMTLSRLCDDDE